jgi:hypothetical protein
MMDLPAGFTVEHKVSHREWDEIAITSEAFFVNIHVFRDDEGFFDGHPTFEFEQGSVFVDEVWSATDSKVSTSSYTGGFCDWSEKDGQYVKCFYGSERLLGQLVSVKFTLSDEIKAAIDAAKQEQSS